MDKRKILCVVIILLVLSLTVYKLNINKVNNKEVDKVQVIDTNENKNNMFAFMIQGDNGNYNQSISNTWPGEGYKLNTERTQCMDNNGVEVKNGITYNETSKIVTVTSSNTSYCYLYFDQVGKGGLEILDNLPISSGLSSDTLGDMRRYQGSSVKNYICINDDASKCNSGDDDMYRIIGIVEDGDEAGQIKVIKEIKYGSFKWHNTYDSTQCSGTTCSWPNNDLAKTLNTTFLNSLPTKVQNVLVSKNWYYGDIFYDYANKDASQIYQIETGILKTTYYDNSGFLITNETWQKTSETRKIGLIYLHDYYWQSTQNNCTYDSSYDLCKSNGWMHITQNGGSTSDQEWMMSRVGRHISLKEMAAWEIRSDGYAYGTLLSGSLNVRPVFYLSSDVKIKSGGTGEKTNPYILDLS